jgi:transposase
VFKPQALPQPGLFVPAGRLVQPATSSFYAKLEQTLDSFGFSDQVRQLCVSAYSDSRRGRPGVDPAVCFKMLLIGFFENISSGRGIAERCNDSISIRFFPGYDLTPSTPDHSPLSGIRNRLGEDTCQEVFLLILSALQNHGLLKGRPVGIDASVIEANAALKSLVNRDTQEAYWEYVRRLASENGVEPKDPGAVRQFDRKRPQKMSNDDWENPHAPDAKIGPTKAGAIDLIYQPEPTVDWDTGAMLQAEVRLGHEADPKDWALHVLQAQANLNQAQDCPADSLTIPSATADKGYHSGTEMNQLQQAGIRTVISDPIKNRKLENLSPEEVDTVRQARRSARSESGKKLLKQRGMHLERSFAHLLDAGGVRRPTLRGLGNLNKRFKLAAAIYNLSQLMRKLWNVGPPKQWAAGVKALGGIFCHLFAAWRARLVNGITDWIAGFGRDWELSRTRLAGWVKDKAAEFFRARFRDLKKANPSTGC